MKIALTALALIASTAPAYAMTWFLTSQWMDGGQRFCRYGNGTILNVGVNLCPLSIEG